jgi:hypothetical protein
VTISLSSHPLRWHLGAYVIVPTIAAQTLTLGDVRGLSRAQRWLLGAFCIPSRVRHASSVHRMPCRNSSSAVRWCLSKITPAGGHSYAPRASDMDAFVWDSPNSHAISREHLHGSRSTAAVMVSPRSPWPTCIHAWCRRSQRRRCSDRSDCLDR